MSKMTDQLNFKGRRVLVTGGGKGIGKAIVLAFVQLGAKVVVFDKDPILLQQLTDEVDPPDAVQVVQVDLADWKATKVATESVLPIHNLVNNAGFLKETNFLDVDEDEINALFAVNFKAAFNVAQVVARSMILEGIRDGTIVNISSTTDLTYLKGMGVYGATKAAITSLTKAMSNELGGHGIRVNYVRPGLINTELVSSLPPPMLKSLTDVFEPRSSLPCLIEPSKVANIVIFLSSPLSDMVTGAPVTIDSGFATA